MALSKKQKSYIRDHYGRQSSADIGRRLNVPAAEIEAAARALGIQAEARTASAPAGFPKFLYHPYFAPGAIALFATIVGIICYDAKLYISGDNVEFMDLGVAVREGNGLLGTTKYTPIFPLLLALVQLISGNSLQAQKVLILLFYVGSAPLMYLIFKKYLGNIQGFAAAALVVMNAFIIEFGHITMSEMPYLFFSLLAIALFEKYDKAPDRRKYFIIALAAIIATYYVRPAALALFAAAVSYFLLRRQWKLAVLCAAIFFVAVLPWNIRNQLLAGGSDYSKALFLKNPYQPQLGTLTIPEIFGRIWYNITLYATQEIPYVLFPFRFRTTMYFPAPFPAVFGVILTILAAVGYVWYFIRHRSIIALYLFFYVGIILLWYEGWSGSRFIVPIMPFFIFFFLYLIYRLVEIARAARFAFAARLAGIAALMVLALLHVRNVYSWDAHMDKYSPDWENYFKAAEWVRDNTPQDAVFCDRKAGLFRIIAGRKGSGTPGSSFGNDPLRHMQFFYERNIDYVIIPSIPYGDIRTCLLPAVQAFGEWFTMVHTEDGNYPTYVLKLDRTKPLPAENPPAVKP